MRTWVGRAAAVASVWLIVGGVFASESVAAPVADVSAPTSDSAEYVRFAQPGWWDTRRRGVSGDERWMHADFPSECYQQDGSAGGVSASAWQVVWAYPQSRESSAAKKVMTTRMALAQTSSMFSASAQRRIRGSKDFYRRSLSPRWVTTRHCEVRVRPVAVPDAVYHLGPHPMVAGGIRDWLFERGFSSPRRKVLVLLQDYPDYRKTGFPQSVMFQPVAENWAGSLGDRRAGLDNVGNYNAFAFVNAWWPRSGARDASARAAVMSDTIVHEMLHAMGAVPRLNNNTANQGHPSECNDVLCYNGGYTGERYVCGGKSGWGSRDAFRIDCGHNDYFSASGDGGLVRQSWADVWPNVADSPFLYGNPQPTLTQLAAGADAVANRPR